MKKRIFSLLVFLFVLIPCVGILSGCNKDETPSVVGTYTVTNVSMTIDGVEASMGLDEYWDLSDTPESELSFEDMMKLMMFETMFEQVLVVKADNTFSLTIMVDGEVESNTGTWTLDGNNLIMTVAGEDEVCVVDGDKLTLTTEADGETITITYEKADEE